ncbi:MAG TPA: hypothetical protein GX736_01340 [Mogibacterium sp.]|nr:hypothetical protein [Mogibacterium sp.]
MYKEEPVAFISGMMFMLALPIFTVLRLILGDSTLFRFIACAYLFLFLILVIRLIIEEIKDRQHDWWQLAKFLIGLAVFIFLIVSSLGGHIPPETENTSKDTEIVFETKHENGAQLIMAPNDNDVTWATVYYTDYGECYHMSPDCISLRKSKRIYQDSLENIRGLRPCDLCVPHSYEY